MRLTEVRFCRFKSLAGESVRLGSSTVLIGANATGKSNVLDGLRLLSEGLRAKDFASAVHARGGIIHLAWKGQDAGDVELVGCFEEGDKRFEWSVLLRREGHDFVAHERVFDCSAGPKTRILSSDKGLGSWWSGTGPEGKEIVLRALEPTTCALAAAAADASFAARGVAEFVQRWGFFDPSPVWLRRASSDLESSRLDPLGRDLAARLYTLRRSEPAVFERILAAAQDVLGVPAGIHFVPSEDNDRVFFLQQEPGLKYRVHQVGASSGTLRMLALLTALLGDRDRSLVGIEEPENYVHPGALAAFADLLSEASGRTQVVVTTHSPLLLDHMDDPAAIRVVRRDQGEGTKVHEEDNPDGVRRALEESGFGLGEFYESSGFGA